MAHWYFFLFLSHAAESYLRNPLFDFKIVLQGLSLGICIPKNSQVWFNSAEIFFFTFLNALEHSMRQFSLKNTTVDGAACCTLGKNDRKSPAQKYFHFFKVTKKFSFAPLNSC